MTKTDVRPAQQWFTEFVAQPGAIDEVASFCGVNPATILSWVNGTWPRGEPQYRLWAFLEFWGMKVAELEALPGPTHQLALMMASQIYPYERAQEYLGYRNLQSLYGLIRGENAPSTDKAWKIEQVVDQFSSELAEFRRGFDTNAAPVAEQSLVEVVPVPAPAVVAETKSAAFMVDSSVEVTAKLLLQVARRIEQVDVQALAERVSNELPREQIERLAVFLLELV